MSMKESVYWTNRWPKSWRARVVRMIRPLLILSALLAAVAAAGAAQNTGRTTWTEVSGAQVKLGDKIPIMWSLYQPDKKDKKKDKDDLVLVLLGRRYLLLDTKSRTVYEVKKSDLQAQGTGFTSDDNLAGASRTIPTTEWSIRDVGPAEKIDLTLS